MRPISQLALIALPALLACGAARADVLLVERAQQATVAMPARGQSMAAVEAQFGTPAERLDPRGGQKRQWPTIHRWVYPAFTVYFERDRVVDAVANQASVTEVGPKPPIR